MGRERDRNQQYNNMEQVQIQGQVKKRFDPQHYVIDEGQVQGQRYDSQNRYRGQQTQLQSSVSVSVPFSVSATTMTRAHTTASIVPPTLSVDRDREELGRRDRDLYSTTSQIAFERGSENHDDLYYYPDHPSHQSHSVDN